MDADSTVFYGYTQSGVYTYKNLQFYRDDCFITDTADYTFNGPGKPELTVFVDHCYFDTLITPKYITVDIGHVANYCYADSSFTKIYADNGKPVLPDKFSLGSAVPNPFNSTVAIEIDVPKDADVTFEIFNILGEKVITLVDEELERGRYKVVWDGVDRNGMEIPSGTYLYRLRSEDFEETKKMTLVK